MKIIEILSLFLSGLLSLAACSPYGFQKEVAAFSSGVDQLSDGFTSGYANLAMDQASQTQLGLTDSRVKVAMAPSCGVPVRDSPQGQLPCALYRFGSDAPAPMEVQKTKAGTLNALLVLKDYAHALAAVINAADRSAFDGAVAQLSGSVTNLSKFAGAAAPGG